MLELNQRPEDVEDIYFTGALTDPGKTDFTSNKRRHGVALPHARLCDPLDGKDFSSWRSRRARPGAPG